MSFLSLTFLDSWGLYILGLCFEHFSTRSGQGGRIGIFERFVLSPFWLLGKGSPTTLIIVPHKFFGWNLSGWGDLRDILATFCTVYLLLHYEPIKPLYIILCLTI